MAEIGTIKKVTEEGNVDFYAPTLAELVTDPEGRNCPVIDVEGTTTQSVGLHAEYAEKDSLGHNIAESLTAIDNKLTWQQIGEVTGANSVTVDSSAYKEFLVIQKYGDIEMSYIILASRMGTRTIDTYGGYTNNSYSVASCIKYNSTSIINSVLSQNSTSYISNTKMTVYAR